MKPPRRTSHQELPGYAELVSKTDSVPKIDLETAEELLRELSPEAGQLWHGRNSPSEEDDFGWVFRGQADADWSLTPSAHRSTSRWSEYYLGTGKSFPPLSKVRCSADLADLELDLVGRFATEVTEKGLELPYDSADLRDAAIPVKPDPSDFPPRPYMGLFALAQHHGIPTRLLDWSTNPLVAAYFACHDIARARASGDDRVPDRLAVWALSVTQLDRLNRPPPATKVRIITVPTSNNPKLHAQGGVFTLVYGNNDTAVPGQPSLDALAAEVNPDPPVLWRFSVPSTNARVLLRLLAQKGVTASFVDPGHEGAAEYLRERSWHQRAIPDERS